MLSGTIFHGRNLDYSYPGLTNLTYTVQFVSGGEIQYYGTAFVGVCAPVPVVRMARR